ncbi:protein-glutamate methylesterase/protein-glutamine glutaminase [Bacillus thermotolerans]|uniref:Protein-glutamate methylesterase/protein-glutamine glutaminase n=1 Tax=Bacillus thermotolerans TaxID=1221996 RepID=A0A0F5IB21_BACTR|nr:chemotaxis response regulator protein-glutamate methylesterase [Bacillus thermotolerans]KKB38957.1 Chemotaxis response regulator protein-glutamate methylesterase CheB [Bacillus thermotolerans]KKB42377.1 Chemotaxis response regulator protein-glutamate methylesterase CheB [Bacillus thermotolerans]
MRRKKVVIADDSAFMRKVIREFLSSHPEMDVVAAARNGKEAIEKVKQFRPDVVTMDVEMPELDGLHALSWIMEHMPTPVVMLSSLTKEGAEVTFEAIEKGAVDFIAKPSGTISLDLYKVKREIIEKVLAASKAKVYPAGQKPAEAIAGRRSREEIEKGKVTSQRSSRNIVVIGTSTGGPRALQQVVTRLPDDIAAPILVVQHMPPGFTKTLAQRLDSLSAVHVKEADHKETLQRGVVYIAPGGFHLKVKESEGKATAWLTEEPSINGHRPAVDVLFESVSRMDNYQVIAVIMTGMGSDGVNGLIQLKKAGGVHAIAESEESCVVFGMPKAAISTQLVDCVAPVENIAEKILTYINR